MDWIAFSALIITAITALIGTIKDFEATGSAAASVSPIASTDAWTPDDLQVQESSKIQASKSRGKYAPLMAWVSHNKVPLSKVVLAIGAAIVGSIAIFNTQAATLRATEAAHATQMMVAGGKKSRPSLRLFLRSSNSLHNLSTWGDEFDEVNAPKLQTDNAVGFLGASLRKVLFYAPASQKTQLDDVAGHILIPIDGMQNDLDVHNNGLVLQLGYPKQMLIERRLWCCNAFPAGSNGPSDGFALDLPFQSEWDWDTLLAWTITASVEKRPLLRITQSHVAQCPDSLPKYSEATIIFELKEHPRAAIISYVRAENLTCTGESMSYALVPVTNPELKM